MKNTFSKIFNGKSLRVIWIIYALCSIFVIVYLLNNLVISGFDNVDKKYVLNEHWNIWINEESYTDVSLNTLHFDAVDKGDIIVMKTSLPSKWLIQEPALCIPINHTMLDVYVDGEIIYAYGYQRNFENKTIGNGLEFVHFSNEYLGKELEIHLAVTEKNAFSAFEPIWISDWKDAYRFVITENRVPFCLGFFLLVFGVVVSFSLIFVVTLEPKCADLFFISLFSICMGLWTLCYNNVLVIFSLPIYTITLIENMAMLLAPFPLMGYMYNYVKVLKNRRWMTSFVVLLVLQFICTVTTIALHSVDAVHSAAMIIYHYVLDVICACYFVFMLYKNKKINKHKRKIYYFGMLSIVIFIFYELLAYAVYRYTGYQPMRIRGSACIGIIVFIVILLVDLYKDITSKVLAEKEKELLIKQAYTDELTQIHNRRFCSEYIEELRKGTKNPYAVIMFDINNLKQINDTYGHVRGDDLIRRVAELISEVFAPKGMVGRMGGDEFMVILPTDNREEIETLIEKFSHDIEEINKSKQEYELSVAYGYAICGEAKDDIDGVYVLADNRMYEKKRIMKSQMRSNSQ